MTIKPVLDKWELKGIQEISTTENRALVEHKIPGLAGSFLQDMGEVPTSITIKGTLPHGDDLRDKFLGEVRKKFVAGKPVPFLADITTETDVKEVVIQDFQIIEVAGSSDACRYLIKLKEYISSPEPAAAGADIQKDVDSAGAKAVDGLTNNMAVIDDIGATLDSFPSIGNPTEPLTDVFAQTNEAIGGIGDMGNLLNNAFPDMKISPIPEADLSFQVVDVSEVGIPSEKITSLISRFREISSVDMSKLSDIDTKLPIPSIDDLSKALQGPLNKINEFATNPLDFININNIKSKYNEVLNSMRPKLEGLPDDLKDMFSDFPHSIDTSKIDEPISNIKEVIENIKKLIPATVDIPLDVDLLDEHIEPLKEKADSFTKVISVPYTILGDSKQLAEMGRIVVESKIADTYNEILNNITTLLNEINTLNDNTLKNKLDSIQVSLSNLSSSIKTVTSKGKVILESVDTKKIEKNMGEFIEVSSEISRQFIAKFESQEISLDLKIDTSILKKINDTLDKIDITEYIDELKGFLQQAEKQVDKIDAKAIETLLRNEIRQMGRDLSPLSTVLTGLFDKVEQEIDVVFTNIKNKLNIALDKFSKSIKTEIEQIIKEIETVVNDALTSITKKVNEFKKDKVPEIRQKITKPIQDVKDELKSDEFQEKLNDVKDKLNTMCDKLAEVKITPIVNSTINEINDMKVKISKIDVRSLNLLLKLALNVAVGILKQIDFEKDISEALISQFKEIRKTPDKAAEALDQKVKEAIEQIDPAILLKPVQEIFDKLVEELKEKTKPSNLLTPINNVYESAFNTLRNLSPGKNLLSPIQKGFNEIIPETDDGFIENLFTPLEKILDEIKGKIEGCITTIIEELTNQIKDIMPGLEKLPQQLPDIKTTLNTLVSILDEVGSIFNDQIPKYLSSLDNLNLDTLLSPFNTLLSTIYANLPTRLLKESEEAMDKTLDIFKEVDIKHLQSEWQKVKDSLSNLSVSNEVKTLADGLDRTSFLPLSSHVDGFKKALDSKKEEFTEISIEFSASFSSVTSFIKKVIPDFGGTDIVAESSKFATAGIQASIPPDMFTELEEIIKKIKTTIHTLNQEDLSRQLSNLIGKTSKKMAEIANSEFLKDLNLKKSIHLVIEELLEGMFNISIITDELNGVIDRLKFKVNELITECAQGIDRRYEEILDTIQQNALPPIIKKLDKDYEEKIVSVLDIVSPNSLLLPPLDATFDEMVAIIQNKLNSKEIFKGLFKSLERLFNELEGGLKRTGVAFNGMVKAIPV